MGEMPIGFDLSSPEDKSDTPSAADGVKETKVAQEPPAVVESVVEQKEVPATPPSAEGEEPKKTLAEVAGLYKKLAEIKEKEPDGEMGGAYRAARLDWERALGGFVRNPDFSSFENNPTGKRELEEAIEKYKTLQAIEEKAKTDTGHVYRGQDITAMNEARSAVRGYFESHLEEADTKHQQEIAGRIEEALSGSTPRPAREVEPTVDLPLKEEPVAPVVEAPKASRERPKVVHMKEARRRLRSPKGVPGGVGRPEKVMMPASATNMNESEVKKRDELVLAGMRTFHPKIGDELRVLAEGGGTLLEAGWHVESIKRSSKDGEIVESVVVARKKNGKIYKQIVDGFDAWHLNHAFGERGTLRMLDSVRIPKSIANVEEGWTIVGYDPLTKIAEVKQYKLGLTEHVSIADLEPVNKPEATRDTAVFTMGDEVRVQRTDGTFEEGWRVGTQSEKTGKIAVMRADGELVKHVTPEELREWNEKRIPTAVGGSQIHEGKTEEEKKSMTPREFISGKARTLFEKLSSTVQERTREIYGRAKLNTLDRAAVLYNNYFYDRHDERVRSLDNERRSIDREINAIREAMLRRSGADFEDVSHTGRALKKKEYALMRGEARVRKLEAKKAIAESRIEHERVKQSVFERRRRDILEKVSGRVGEAVRPHEIRMERIGGSIQRLEKVVDREQQKREQYQRELERLEGQMKHAPRTERRILKTMHEEIRAALQELDSSIHGRKKDLVRLEKERARVSAKAQPWRETQLRFQGLIGKK